jgi:uncharacterized membrane protein HdeD (DUF308 family)
MMAPTALYSTKLTEKTAMSTSRPSLVATQVSSIAAWSIWIAVIVILAGLLAIILPIVGGIAVTLIVGWILTLVGLLHLAFAFGARGAGARIWELLLGVVYVVAGFYLIFHPILGLTALTLLLASYLLIKGILELVQYFQTHPRRGVTWLILDGVINIVLAVIIWSQWPFSSLWVIGTLVGISIVFSGISRLMLSLEARRALAPASI